MEQGTVQQQPYGAPGVPRLRPLDVGGKLDAAIKLTMRNFGTLVAIVLLVAVPLEILSFVITLSTLPDDFVVGNGVSGSAGPEEGADVSAAYVVGQFIIFVIGVSVTLLAPAACFKAIGSAYLGQKATWQDSLRYALKRFWAILAVTLLYGLAVMGGTIALIAPGVWLFVVFSLAVPALMLEGAGPIDSMSRSFNLIKDFWWRTFGFYCLTALLVLVVSAIVGGVLVAVTLATLDDSSVAALAVQSVINVISQVVTTPLIAAVIAVQYFDLRIRKEAFDLQLLAQSIGGDAPTQTPAPGAMPWVAQPGWAPAGWGQQPAGWGQPPAGWGQPPGGPGPPPQQWGQPQQQWGQPQGGQPPPGGPGPLPQQWGQPQGGQPPPQQQGWGQPPGQGAQPGQPPAPPGPDGPQWGRPQRAPGPLPQQWGEQPPAEQHGSDGQQRWEPPAPPQSPPEPPQQWEPPAPPDPPSGGSSS